MRTHNQPGLGGTVVLRRQPARVVQSRVQGGYTSAYELVCCDCGDHPDLDYRDVSPERQRIRGPYSIAAGVAAYEVHVNVYHRQQPGQAVHDAGRRPACAGGDEGRDLGLKRRASVAGLNREQPSGGATGRCLPGRPASCEGRLLLPADRGGLGPVHRCAGVRTVRPTQVRLRICLPSDRGAGPDRPDCGCNTC